MKAKLYLFATAWILLATVSSCHTSRKQASATTSKEPTFIDGMYMNRHGKNTGDRTVSNRPPAKGNSGKSKNATAKHNREHNTAETPASLKEKYADIIGVREKEITNTELYRFIDEWYGTRYRIGGTDKSGIDCSGFAQKLYSEVYGMDLVRTSMEQFGSCKMVRSIEDAEEGDLVFFSVNSNRITHVGVYLANSFFVHSSTSNGVMISNLNEDYWKKYYAGMGRVPRG